MHYSYENIKQLLRELQSLNYPRYEKYEPVDVLVELLRMERICDYSQIEWKAFGCYLYEKKIYDFPFCDDETNYEITLGNSLEIFCNKIVGKAETVRVLTFLRDHAYDSVFKGDNCHNIDSFSKECSRLIYVFTNERRPDEYHGRFADMPHPDLQQIALGDKAIPKLNCEEKIIANHLPSYPHDIGAFPKPYIIRVAQFFVESFRAQVDAFNRTRLDSDKPVMSQQKYKNLIRDELIRTANRMLIFEDEPIYQVFWVMAVIMRLPHKAEWWQDKFAQGIMDYLDCTTYFSNLKLQMDNAIREIRHLSEPCLELSGDEQPQQSVAPKYALKTKSPDQLIKHVAEDLLNFTEKSANYNIRIEHLDALVLGDNVNTKYSQS